MSQLLEQVEESVRARSLFKKRQPILVAVSGGVDSMVLLHLLHSLADTAGWRLTVAHLNHALRGRASHTDERFVARAAKRLQLPVVTQVADVKGLAGREKISVEMAARQLRHQFLSETAARLRIPSIALAHHADDQVELFFLRLFRGAGAEGLSGMRWKSPSPHNSKLQLVRPLLGQTRGQIIEFAVQNRILFRQDESNDSLDFQRNRIRHQLLPELVERHQPALRNVILRQMELLGAEADHIATEARDWLRDRKGMSFAELPLALQRKVLALQLHEIHPGASFDLIELLRCQPGRRVCARDGLALWVDKNGVVRPTEPAEPLQGFRDDWIELNLGKLRTGHFDRLRLMWAFDKRRGRPARSRARCEWFDAEKVGTIVRLRHWRRGDRFRPIGMSSPVKLQDLFTNQRISRTHRHQLVVATTEQDEIWWVEGMRIGELFKITPLTTRRLKWQWRD